MIGAAFELRYQIVIVLFVYFVKSSYSNENFPEAEPIVDPQTEEEKMESRGFQKMSFKAAKLTEEDEHSEHMPRDLACDGCRIVSYVVKQKLKKMQGRYKPGHKFSETDVIDLLDEICKDKEDKFGSYGIKEIMGVRRLSGEGLETKDVPGMMQGGGKWPHRLRDMCIQYVSEVGEDVIYEHFLAKRSLENLICRNEELGAICRDKKKKKSTQGKEKENVEKKKEKGKKKDKKDKKEVKEKKDKKEGKDKKDEKEKKNVNEKNENKEGKYEKETTEENKNDKKEKTDKNKEGKDEKKGKKEKNDKDQIDGKEKDEL